MKKILFALTFTLSFIAQAQNFTGDTLSIVSSNSTLNPGQILFGGTINAGDTTTVTITIGETPHAFTETIVSGDTFFTMLQRFVTSINAALGPSITASIANPIVTMLAISPHRDGNPLPVVSFSVTGSLTAALISQAADILDAYPNFICGHGVPGQIPKAGDSVCLTQRVAPHFENPSQPNIAYQWEMTHIGDPNLATLSGYTDIGGACNVASNGYVCPIYRHSKGLAFFDAAGNLVTGGDKGYGTINLPSSGGLYVNGKRVEPKAAFRATMNGANQINITENIVTKLNFSTPNFNLGASYDASNARWTPPAGLVRLACNALWQTASANNLYLFIGKNGAVFAGHTIVGNSNGKLPSITVSTLDNANGTDQYDCRVLVLAPGPHIVDGQIAYTWFEGAQQ